MILDFSQINYQYINRFTIDYFKEFLLFQSHNISYKEIDTSLFITYKFIDPTFLHIPQNIYGANFNQNQHKEKQVVWLQPEDISRYNQSESYCSFNDKNKFVLFEQISPSNIIQGESMNCYFLAVLQSLCLNPQLIKSIFDLQQSKPEIGLYCCKFYSNGYAENVIIDEYLPCHNHNKKLIYSKFYKNSIWVALLEKAWAKMNGSYFDAEQLLIEDAMENIFPYPTEGFWIKDFTKQDLLNILQKSIKNNYIIVVTTKVDLKDENISLIQNHAYSFLSLYIYKGQTIIKLKNPWGKNEWQGKLQKSNTQKVKELKQALGNYFDDEKDGILNMTLKEFQQYFAYVCIQYFEAGYQYSSIKIQLMNRKAKYYKFKLNFKTKLCLRLIQTTKKDLSCQKIEFRLFKISNNEVSQVFYNGQDCWESNRVTYVQSKSSFVDLDKGEYVIKVKIYKDEKIKDGLEEVVLSSYSSVNLKLELLNRIQGKEINNNFLKDFFNNIKPIQVSSYGVIQEGWDKYYRYLLKIQNKGKQSITYLSNILLKSNLMISNPEIQIINKTSFKVELQPSQIKLIKFKIKKPIKKAKILINHQFQ
ncbi:calpain family cysteine protease (macronuclear) [Tetrahymena thermophila SB210]|uniref:Calpain family cysteine protease n=1 Tax=Tetrahymena thermophila (strain SB210) TaxID=312017 RepID=I7MM41_TETTS|nr:calpain family cysteine protease [Tetrahymena thermophila SB210]EAS03919.2 calpain family cysteine protease [Tetrahymena thermophila SB210]|eukprot:XP_001024164.2 calpain family cysteine protease [Tetrahymena thermophila SB210]